jgi:hypothetical protein
MDERHKSDPSSFLVELVLRGELSLDEALLAASEGLCLPAFVEGLNAAIGGAALALADAEKRVASGEARAAVEGSIPRLECPSEPGADPMREVFNSDKALAALEERLNELWDRREEVRSALGLIRAVQKGGSKPPKPWLAGTVVMAFGWGAGGVHLTSGGSLPAGMVICAFFTGLAAMVALADTKRYQSYLRKAVQEDKWRRAELDSLETKRRAIDREIEELRLSARETVERLGEEESEMARASHLILFPPTEGG